MAKKYKETIKKGEGFEEIEVRLFDKDEDKKIIKVYNKSKETKEE